MSRIPSTGLEASTSASSAASAVGTGDLRDVDLNDFLLLMITELQNQDPLDPLENGEILQQMSQIREIGATDSLSETLDSVLAGQNLTTASGLIGKEVEALRDDGERFSGVVDRVTIETSEEGPRTLRVHIGEESFRLENVGEIRTAELDSNVESNAA